MKGVYNYLTKIIFICLMGMSLNTYALSVIVNNGDIYQPVPNVGGFLTQLDNLTMYEGGTIISYSNGTKPWFDFATINIYGGLVDTNVLFDRGPSAIIEGGVFNGITDIDRMNNINISGGVFNGVTGLDRTNDITISGGLFTQEVDVWALQGGLLSISGGRFQGGLSMSAGSPGGDVRFIGDNWAINGQLVNGIIPNNPFYITGKTGLLTGVLEDGSSFRFSLNEANSFDTVSLVSTVPLPSGVWLFGSALVGLFGIIKRKKTT